MGSEGKREATGSGSKGAPRGRWGRLFAAYAAVGLLVLAALGAVFALSSGSTSSEAGNPHINVASGSTNGVPPDNRPGNELAIADLNLRDAARRAGCALRLHLPDEGHKHIPATAPAPDYGTSPPVSGSHIDEQQADGAYREAPRPVAVVHSLEHGRLAIQYRPELPERAQRDLIGLFGGIYGGTLLFPDQKMPYAVAATTWTNLLGCRSYHGLATLAAIRAFGRATWGKYGGEPLAGLRSGAPTPSAFE